jgi:Tol biopolymer transport system component
MLLVANPCQADDRDWIVVTGHSELNPPNVVPLWRVYSDGTHETLTTIQAPVADTFSNAGSKMPLLAPDKSKIAFVRDDNLWIYDFRTKTAAALTKFGKVGRLTDGRYVLRKLLVARWAPDSSKILFVLTGPAPGASWHPDPLNGVSAAERKAAVYIGPGFHIFDLALGTSEPMEVDLDPEGNDFIAWLPNGDFLFRESTKPADWLKQLVRIDPKTKARKIITTALADYHRHQTSISNDGQWLIAAITDRYGWRGRNSQIIKINLLTGDAQEITTRGDFAEYQRPRVSSLGQRIAYLWAQRRERGIVYGSIVVDGHPIYPYTHGANVYWINEKVVVVKDNEHLAVVDVDTTKVLARHVFQKN